MERIPQMVASSILGITESPLLILLIINILLHHRVFLRTVFRDFNSCAGAVARRFSAWDRSGPFRNDRILQLDYRVNYTTGRAYDIYRFGDYESIHYKTLQGARPLFNRIDHDFVFNHLCSRSCISIAQAVAAII